MTVAQVKLELGPYSDELSMEVAADLLRVRNQLWTVVEGNSRIVNETARYLLDAGGKMLRPLLTLLGSRFGEGQRERVIDGAVMCELTHLASLYHDDVMDQDEHRRGAASVNARWGNNIAILAGDYLLAVAAQISLDLGQAAQFLHAVTARRMVRGQIHESVGPGEQDDPVEHYFTVAADKTASLLSASVQLGAILVGAEDVIGPIGAFGENLGVAFQIANDLFDLQGGSTDGRGEGSDLRFATPTLPIVYVRAMAGENDQRLLQLLDADSLDRAERTEAVQLIRRHSGYLQAQLALFERVRNASEALMRLPACPARQALMTLTQVACNPGTALRGQ